MLTKHKSPIACFFGLLLILLILSLSIGATHAFAKDSKISGYVRMSSGNEISGVTITFSNGEGSTTTDKSGYYSQKVKKGWSGTATPFKVGYDFDPVYLSYSKIIKDQKDQDYIGTQVQQTVIISGNVRTSSGSGIDGVAVTFSNGGETAVTNVSGYYAKNLDKGWGGTVTTVKEGYRFMPEYRNYSNVKIDQLNQDYAGYIESAQFHISIDIVGSGNIRIDPDQDIYTENATISLSAIADMGWVFSEWRGDLESSNNQETVSIISDMVVYAVFLEDYDNDGVSDKEENSNPSSGDGNKDGILDSIQNHVTSKLIHSANKYVTFETPVGTSIDNFVNVVDPSNNYPNEVQFSYGFFSFILKGISTGDSTSVILYFPSDTKFNTYYKYGPTPEDQFDNWYEFIYDNNIGAEIIENIITLHFVDGEKGDGDLIKNGRIIDIGGPGSRAIMSPESSSQQTNGDTDSYGCFIESLF